MIRRRIVVHGDVQGVGFRWSCAREAQCLGVQGWVLNRADGAAEGDLVTWAHHGLRHAVVSRVEVIEEAPHGLRDFQIEA